MEGQTNRQVSSAGHPRRVSHPKGSRRPVSCSGYREKRPVYNDNSPGDRENSPGYRKNSSACHDDCSEHHENNAHPLRSPRPASSSGYLGHHHQPRSGEDTRSPSASGERHRHPRRTSRPASSTVYSGSRLYAKRSSRPSSGYPGRSSPTRSKRPWTAPVSGHRSHRGRVIIDVDVS
ncbi:hypothetical protein BaRGS_00035045 [Batillaria attramentaria]|uniref:Uncharacterized protein n=1 Tax=Batillaria attramentaria TaxID=370345 RepID=A0ABD0JFU8_9CAEN